VETDGGNKRVALWTENSIVCEYRTVTSSSPGWNISFHAFAQSRKESAAGPRWTYNSKNLETLNLFNRNGIILLQLPGHTTQRLQAPDVSIFGPVDSSYEHAV
jgi:hypothetical protein